MTAGARRRPRGRRDPWASLRTEAPNPRARDIDRLPTRRLLDLLHAEDRRALDAVRRALPQLTHLVGLVDRALAAGGRLIYIGAGTSGRLGVADAAELPPTFGLPFGRCVGVIAGGARALRRSVEGAEDRTADGVRAIRRLRVDRRDAVVGISASSLAPYVRAALREAKRRGAATALVTMNRIRRPRGVDLVVAAEVGPEAIAGSTRMKAGLATKAILASLSTAAMVRRGKVYGNRMVDLHPWSAKLEARARRILRDLLGLGPAAADRLLARAGGRVKTALVMGRLGVDRTEARRLLRAAGGDLRRVLGAGLF